ncbi:hypothetical protein T439DRAFT_321760 [Meredithblackwellia eburnea MCA 4105]
MTETATPQSILTALLLDSTAFLAPSLASIRTLLDSTAPSLSKSTDDNQLKQYLKEIIDHQNYVRKQVKREIKAYRLGPNSGTTGKRKGKEREVEDQLDGLEEEGDEELISLEELCGRLEKEERKLDEEIEVLDRSLMTTRQRLDASAESILKIPKVAAPPSVKRALEDQLQTLENDVKKLRESVKEVEKKAAEVEV